MMINIIFLQLALHPAHAVVPSLPSRLVWVPAGQRVSWMRDGSTGGNGKPGYSLSRPPSALGHPSSLAGDRAWSGPAQPGPSAAPFGTDPGFPPFADLWVAKVNVLFLLLRFSNLPSPA